MSSNAERFLAAFNTIEQTLKKQLQLHRHYSFIKVVDIAKKRNPIVEKFEGDLKKYAELRNAIVHERVDPGFIIAEPHSEVVEDIEFIGKELTKPKKVIPSFACKVATFHVNDPLMVVLDIINQRLYTQFPIYDHQGFYGLLTESGIAKWLANQLVECPNLMDVRLLDVMAFEKHINHVIFVSQNENLYEVKEHFVRQMDMKMTRLHAVLITESGDRNDPLLGIITPHDVIRFE
ncbi:CBS domain-containing protein [Desertibacillus haloalkaliphilus]|uniref:CBS domain-containing protein n=1 Tax=Desertibacillus haloalkaliphilus TaxID=1328930 RepID=UPI001C261177|nr:CBS domain-containing protein [Desertibacillus haloalkaliphilus]MBU8905015.1 CBS domain-containing protein [Desertibacillus haloalkaliphilus]